MKTQKRKNSNSRKYFSADVYNRESGPLEIGELETPSERWSTPVDAVLYLAGSKCQNFELEDTYSGEVSDFVDARSVESDGESSNENESGNYYERETPVERSNRSNYRNLELKTKQINTNHSKHLSTLSSKFAQELKLRYATNAASNLQYQNSKPIRDTFFHNMDYIHSQYTTFNPNYLNFRYGHFSYPNYPVVTHSEYYPSAFQSRCAPNCLNQFQNCNYCMTRVYPMNYDVYNKPESVFSRNSDNYFNKSSQNHQRYSDTNYGASQNNTSGSNYSTNVNYSNSKWDEYTPRSLESYKDSKYFFDKYFYRTDSSYKGLNEERKEYKNKNLREQEEFKPTQKKYRERRSSRERLYRNIEELGMDEYEEKEEMRYREQIGTDRHVDRENRTQPRKYTRDTEQDNYNKKSDSQSQNEQLEFNKYLESYYKSSRDQKETDHSSSLIYREDTIQTAIEKAVKNALENYLSTNKMNKGDETCHTDPVNREFTFDKNDATLTNEEQEKIYSTNYTESINLSQYGQEEVNFKEYKNYESVIFDLKKLADEIEKESNYLDTTFLENNKENNNNNEYKFSNSKEKEYQNESNKERNFTRDTEQEDKSENLVGNKLFDSQVSNEFERMNTNNKIDIIDGNNTNNTQMNSKQFDFESSFTKRGYVEMRIDESGNELMEPMSRSGLVEGGGLFDKELRLVGQEHIDSDKKDINTEKEYRNKNLREQEYLYENQLLDEQMTNRDDEFDLLAGSEYEMENEFERILNDIDDRDSVFETRDYEMMNKKEYTDTNYFTSSSFNINTFNSFNSMKENSRKFNFENLEYENENMNGTTLSTSDLMESRNNGLYNNNREKEDNNNNEYKYSNSKEREYQNESNTERNFTRDTDNVSVDLVNNPFGITNPFYQNSENSSVVSSNVKMGLKYKNKEKNKNRNYYEDKKYINKEVLDSNSEVSSYNRSQSKNDEDVSLILDKVNRLESSLRKVESRLNSKNENSCKSERNTELYEGSPIKSPTTMTPAGVNQVSDVELMEGYKAASLIKKLLHVKSMESLVPAFTAFLQNRRI